MTGAVCVTRAKDRLAALGDRARASTFATTDVDAEAAAGDPGMRAEYGDRLPVVLLDGREHSYWEIDEPRLRADLGRWLAVRCDQANQFGKFGQRAG